MRQTMTCRSIRRNTPIIFMLLILLCPASAFAENLLDVYSLALKNDPRFIGARFERDASAETLTRARAGLMPKLSAEGVYTQTNQKIVSSDNTVYGTGTSSFPSYAYSLTLVQPLFNYASFVGVARAKADVKGSDLKLEATRQDLAVRVAKAYLGVLASRDNLVFTQAEESAVSKHYELIDSKFSSGLVPKTDYIDAKARMMEVKANKIAAESTVDDALQSLKEITGQSIFHLTILREELPLIKPDPNNIDTWIDAAVKQNPALEMQRQAVEAANQEVRRQKAGHYPYLNLEANYNKNKTEGTLFGGGSDVETTSALFRLSVPLFEGGIVNSRTKEAMNLYKAAIQEEERQKRALEKETRAAYLGVANSIDRVVALRQAVESKKLALQARNDGYKSGLFTLLAVLDAERDLLRARQDYAMARYDYVMNSLRLKKSVGILNEPDIAAINGWLDSDPSQMKVILGVLK